MADENKTDAADAGVKVRVLLAHQGHEPNHVITLSAAEAKTRKKEGLVDDSAAGVAYAEANEPQPKAKG